LGVNIAESVTDIAIGIAIAIAGVDTHLSTPHHDECTLVCDTVRLAFSCH
jgi:hypothetical protein